jgi:hypothetical protein
VNGKVAKRKVMKLAIKATIQKLSSSELADLIKELQSLENQLTIPENLKPYAEKVA